MKKLILLVSMIMTLAFSTMAFAAGDGTALNNEEKSAEKLLTAVTSQTATVESLNGILSPEMAKKINATALKAVQTDLKNKFGSMKESKMVVYERLDQQDRVTYLAAFTKEKVVRYLVLFNKEAKPLIVGFAFGPVNTTPAPAKK
jgi:D-aminopeptidase